MQELKSDWQRLESVIKWANMTTNYFARHIGLSRGENLYQIKRGNNGISRNIAMLIADKFPEINTLWLLTGAGQMFGDEKNVGATVPFYRVGVEENIRNIDSLTLSQQLMLPDGLICDFAMCYLGRAMGGVIPTNSIIFLKKTLPKMIIPGDECVIVTKNVVLLRIAKIERGGSEPISLRLISTNSDIFGDVVVGEDEIEATYKVVGKILINN